MPQGAFPQVGVCAGLQVSNCLSKTTSCLAQLTCLQARQALQNPAQATKFNLTGIAYAISKIDEYYALTEPLLKKNMDTVGKDL